MSYWIEPHMPGKMWGDICLSCGRFASQHVPYPIFVKEEIENE